MRKLSTIQPTLLEPWLDVEHAKELRAISEILDQRPEIQALILQDLHLSSGAQADTGADGLSADPVPSRSSLAANIKALMPETLEAINRIVVLAASREGIDNGAKVRIDCTVTESNIHHPTDSALLWDGVRVLVRLMGQARQVLGETVVFYDRTRRAKRRRRQIGAVQAGVLERQRRLFARVPLQVAADGAFASKDNLACIKQLGFRTWSFPSARGWPSPALCPSFLPDRLL